MRKAKVNTQIVQASPDSPDRAQCPACLCGARRQACDAPVVKRKRHRMDGAVAHFYRHVWNKE